MKATFFILLIIVALTSISITKEKCKLKGTWNLSLLTLQDDTLFMRNHPIYTLRYHYNKENLKMEELGQDQIAYNDNIAITSYKKFLMIHFDFKGFKFSSTKIDRKGPTLNEVDNGTYKNVNDTIYLSFTTRKDKEAFFFDCERGKLISLKNNDARIEFQKQSL